MDRCLKFHKQISAVIGSSFFSLHSLTKIKYFLPKRSMETAIHALITSRLDYCNSLYFGISKSQTARLQIVQNAAARFLKGKRKFDHATPLLRSLHWLPINFRIDFKILLLVFESLNDLASSYLSDLLHPYLPTRGLRSKDKFLLQIPTTRLKSRGNRAFEVAGPTLWNKLPLHIRSASTLSEFKSCLKTYLFSVAFIGQQNTVYKVAFPTICINFTKTVFITNNVFWKSLPCIVHADICLRCFGLESQTLLFLWPGICVSEEKIQVSQDISVDVPLPYSMVRGEQIELRGSVYNQHLSKTEFRVTLTATDGVCVFRGAQQGKDGKPHENKGKIGGRSVALVTFYIMALEAGTHTLTFTLTTKWGTESVVKKLKVVPEGIRKEIQIGGRIDPNGVFGTSMRKLEFKNVIPPNIVPKSTVDRILTVNGEVLGALLSIINNPEGLKQLTNLPRGNAEMELMGLLPIYYVYNYLEKTEKWGILGKEAAASEKELKRKMQAGITSIMSFKLKHEPAFSMWSKKDKSASTWVTALIVKTLADMHEYISLESEVLTNTINWLIKNCQNDDGSFSEKSQTNPLKLMGAGADVTEKTVFLTSFVMIGIKNAMKVPNVNLEVFKIAIDRAAQYITSNSKKIKSLYARAIASYALTLADIHSMSAVEVYEILKKQAQVDGNPATVRFWQESKLGKDSLKPSDATAKTVETTVYVLLNTLVRGDTTYAKPILNWLTQDQRYGGGVHSTQDSILTLEALTKYSILTSRATLNMVVDIEYKTKGDIRRITLTQQNPVHKPIEVTKNDDIIIKTAMSSGVSFASLRTVFYEMTENNENCYFDMSIDIHEGVPNSDDPMLLSQRIVACAKYKPPENEFETESGITVMEIHLPTGVTAVQEDLDRYLNGLESRISNYEINGDQVILQIDSIPSEELYCVGFRIQEEFETGMTRASVFQVYQFSNPEHKCMKFYHKQSRKLLRLCEGDQCQCMAAECCNFKSTIDPKITAVQRKNDMCKESMNYAFKVLIESSEAGGDFVTYKAKVKAVLMKGQTDDLKTDSEIDLVKKATCSSTNFEVGKQYLIMTAESIKIRMNRGYKYKFPLDSRAWVDWWPLDTDCRDDACIQYANVLGEFESDFVLFGCED
uniref:Complement component 5 n=1 Tax=Cyprinus carpio TaxID=7962 RepID=A0A8C2CFE3_CYPCA